MKGPTLVTDSLISSRLSASSSSWRRAGLSWGGTKGFPSFSAISCHDFFPVETILREESVAESAAERRRAGVGSDGAMNASAVAEHPRRSSAVLEVGAILSCDLIMHSMDATFIRPRQECSRTDNVGIRKNYHCLVCLILRRAKKSSCKKWGTSASDRFPRSGRRKQHLEALLLAFRVR